MRPQQEVHAKITHALSETRSGEDVARDIAFHMLDWYDDLKRFVAFCEDPASLSAEQVEEMLMDFLVHVPNHVAAAGVLMTGMQVSDIFGVGAVRSD